MANTNIELLAGLDLTASEKQVIADIRALQRRLEAAGIGIKLTAKLDEKLLESIKDLGKKEISSAGQNLGEELATNLINSFNIKSKDAQKQIKSLTKSLYEASVGEIKTGKENQAFVSMLDQLGIIITKNANIIQQRMGIYDEFYQYFQNLSKIKIPDIVKSDLGKDWNTMRMTAASKFVTNAAGIELDSIYQEMSDKFKGLFSGTTDQVEQFREIVNALRAYRADVDKLIPLDASSMDQVWGDIVQGVGSMRVQIQQNLDSIPDDFQKAETKIKTLLLNINRSFDDTADFDKLTAEVKGYFQSLTGLSDKDIRLQFFKNANEDITSFSATLEKGQGIVEKYNFTLDNLGKFSYSGGNVIDKSGEDLAKVTAKAAEYQQKLESLKSTYQGFLTGSSANNPFKAFVESIDFSKITDKGALDAMLDKFRQAEAQAKALNASINKDWAFNGAQKMAQELSSMGSQLDILEAKFKGANFQIPDSVTESFRQMRESLSGINRIDNPEQKIAAYNQLKEQLKELNNQYSLLSKQQKNLDSMDNLLPKKQKLGSDIVSWMVSNEKASRQFDNVLVKIITDLQNVTKNSEVEKLAKQFQAVKAQAQALDKTSGGFFQGMKEQMAGALKNVFYYQASYKIINKTRQAIQDMITDVEELQASLIEFNKVADISESQLEEFSSKAYQTGNKIARTGKDIIDGMSEFRRAGYDVSKVLDMSEAANVMVNVGDGIKDVEGAASSLIAVLRGFKMNESQIMEIVDILNQVSNNAPIAFSDLAEGLERTSGTLAQTGTSLAESVGLLTGGFAQLRNIEKVSTGLITISQRLRGVDEDGEAIDGLAAELQEAFGSIGVVIEDANGELRSTYDIINDYAKVFPTLSSKQKQYFGELASGKRQVTVWNAMVSGINDVNHAIEEANNSMGSAAKENEIYMNSIAGSRNAFENAMDMFAKEAVDDQWISDFINAGTSLLNTMTNLISTDTVVRNTIGDIAEAVKNLAGLLENLSGNKFLAGLAQAFITIKTLQMGSEIVGLAVGAKNASNMFSHLMSVVTGYGSAQRTATAAVTAASSATGTLTNNLEQSRKGILACVTAIGKFAMAHPVISAGTVALGIGIKAWDNYANRVKYAKEALEESKGNFESVSREVESLNDELEENRNRMKELNSQDKLTYAEKGELENLQAITKELERQKDIKDKELQKAAEDLYKKNLDAFKKEFADNNFNLDDVNFLAGMDTPAMTQAENGLEGLIAALVKVREAQEEAEKAGDEEWLQNMEAAEKAYKDQLVENLATLQEYKNNLDEIKGYRALTGDEQDFYGNLEQGIKLIYQFTDPNTWNNIEFNDIFNAEGIEKTKEELIEMEKAGKFDESVISSCKNLSKAIAGSNLILEDGQTAMGAFIEQIKALAKESSNVSGLDYSQKSLSYSGTIAELDKLTSAMSALNEAYVHFKDKDSEITFDDISEINEQFKDVSGIENYIKAIQDAKGSTEATQQAFDNLLSAYLRQTGILTQVTDENKDLIASYLEEKGVANSVSLVESALAANKYLASLETRGLADATAEEIVALTEEEIALDSVKAMVYAYLLEKNNANNLVLATDGDIKNIMALVSACGSGVSALKALYSAKQGIFLSLGSPEKTPGGMSKDEMLALTSAKYGGGIPLPGSKNFDAYKSGLKKQLDLLDNYNKEAEKEVNAAISNLNSLNQAVANGGDVAKKNGGSKDKTTKDDTEKYDLIKQKIDELRDSYSKLQSEANNSDNTYANQLNFLNAAISKQEELIQLERTALDIYKNDWIQAASVLPENLRDLIMNGSSDPNTAIQSLSGTLKEQFETAQKAWNTYKELMDQIGEDEKELNQNQKSRYQKQIEKDKSEIEKLKEKSSIEQDSYESNLDFLNQAVAKSEELSKKLQERAEEAKQEWEEAKAVIESIGSSGDIAKIMNGELNLSDFEDNPEYYSALERGINAHEDLMDTEEELEENEISLEELRKQAFEKGMQYLKSQQDLIKNTNSTTQTAIELIEALGGEATADMYQDMIDKSDEEISLLEEQIDMLDERISQVDEESAEYYELKGQIEEANQAILQCKINQQKWNEAIMDLPIRKLERYQAILKNIKQDLQNWLNQQSALTNPTTQSQYQSLIDLASKQIKSGLEEIAQLQKKLAQYEPNSDKYKETAQQIQDIKDEIANAIQNQIEWNEAIKQIPINNINRLKTNQDNVKQDLQNWISEQQALGNQIGADQYQKLFDIGNTQIATRLEKIALLTKNLETYDPNSEKYQETLEEIQATKNEISSIVQEQIEWNEAIKQIPIDNINKLLTGYENVAQALENWKAEQEALGNDISAEQYQKQFDLATTQIEGKQEKLRLLQEKLATYEPNSEKYLETLQAIADTKNEISSLVQDQAKWNEEIRNIPIKNIERLQSGYQNVRSSLEEWIATQETLGYTTSEDQYQSLIDMASTQIESNVEKLRLLQEKLATYEPNSTGYNETLQAIADTKSEINSLVQDQAKWNEAIKQIPLNNIAKLQEGYSGVQTKLEDWISKQEALNHVIDADAYQKLIDLGSDQISSHIEEIELLKKNLTTYEPGTTQYDETLKAIDEAENKISAIVQDQAEWNEALKQLPINNVERLQKGLTNLQSKLEAWNNQQTALGNVIGEKQYQTLIDVSGVQIDALNEKISILKQNLETYEPNSAKYDETLQSIQDAENEIASIVQSQIEWNEQLKQIPIDRIDVLQDKYSNLRQDLQNWIDEQGALGRIIGRDQYQSLFDFSQVQLEGYLKKLDLLQEKLKTYEEGSDKYNETAQAIQDVKNEISSVIQEQANWNAEILNMPLDHLNKYTEQLQLVLDSLQGVQDEMNTAISAVTETIDRETDAINEQKEAIEDEKESTEDAYQTKIDAIQEIIDGLKDAREEEDLLLKIEKARAAWQKAQEQKTKKVLREGTWHWESDIEEILNTKKDLDDALLDKQIDDLEKEIEALENERDALLEGMDDQLEKLDDQIEKLDKISEKWQQISKDAEYYANILKATEQLGEGWQDKVLSGEDADIFEPFRQQYLQNSAMMDQYQQQIESNERIAALMEQYINGWKEGAISYENAYENMDKLLSQMKDGFSAFENLDGTLDLNASLGNGESLAEILSALKDNSTSSADEFKEYLSQVQDNNEVIADFTKSWKEVEDSVLSQLEVLKQNYDIMAGVDYDSIQANADAINQFTASWNDIRGSIDAQIEALKQNYASMDKIDYDAIRANADAMNQFNQSWAEIRDSVNTQISELQKNYEALGSIDYDALMANTEAMNKFIVSWKDMQHSISEQVEELKKNYETLEKVDYDVVKSNSETLAKFTATWKEIEASIDKQLASLQKNYDALEKVNYNTVKTNAEALDKIVASWKEVESSIQDQLEVLQKNYKALDKIDYSAVKANTDAINKQTASWKEMQASIQKQMEELEKAFNQPQKVAVEVTSSIYRGDSDKDRDDKEPIGTTVTAVKVIHAGKLGDTSDNWTKYYHDGMKSGLVGGRNLGIDDKVLELLSLEENLKPYEVPIIAKEGEVVLNREQIANVVDNYGRAASSGMTMQAAPLPQTVNREVNHHVDVGGVEVVLPNVTDGNSFLRTIDKHWGAVMHQIAGRDVTCH